MMPVRGFSLIEMAFVLVIVTLLLGGLLVPFTTQVEQKRIAETQKALEEIKEALIGYAQINKRLPCPDTDHDGVENTCAAAAESEGLLPWSTLGSGSADAWGNRFRYRVTTAFTSSSTLALTVVGTLQVCTDASCSATLGTNLPAVIVSHGKNGYGGVNANRPVGDMTTHACPGSPAACSLDEAENINTIANNNFVSRPFTPAPTPAGEFDDLVAWISPNVLFNRLIAAGQLP